MEYLPGSGRDRSRLEAQQRGAGLRPGDITLYWMRWIVHPVTGQEALVIRTEADKEFLSEAELDSLLTQEQAEAADWFLEFEEV